MPVSFGLMRLTHVVTDALLLYMDWCCIAPFHEFRSGCAHPNPRLVLNHSTKQHPRGEA